MSAAAKNYRKIGGVGHQVGGYYRLYAGDDHLLQVSFAGYNERYKRFYFRDIQAFIVQPTNAWLWEMSVCGFFVLVTALIAIAVNDRIGSSVFAGIAGIFVIAGVWRALRGPSCRCYVRTAVQLERLPSI